MYIFRLDNHDNFNDMVPADPRFDSFLLKVFLESTSSGFPIASMMPTPEGEPRVAADMFLLWGLALPVFSLRAMNALTDLLATSGAFHHVQTPIGPYFAFNVTRIIDALDYSRSDIEYWC